MASSSATFQHVQTGVSIGPCAEPLSGAVRRIRPYSIDQGARSDDSGGDNARSTIRWLP